MSLCRKLVFAAGSLALAALLLASMPRAFNSREAAAEEKEKKEKPKPNYVGATKCGLCHNDPKAGDQLGQWKKSKHAKAYQSLATAKAKEIAGKAGIKDPQKDLKCTKCHVTGIEEPARSKKLKPADGVQCETCHGAGEFYAKNEVFNQGRKVAIEHGLVIPDEKLCTHCHNKESPTFPGEFNFKEMWKKVNHPDPRKKEEGK